MLLLTSRLTPALLAGIQESVYRDRKEDTPLGAKDADPTLNLRITSIPTLNVLHRIQAERNPIQCLDDDATETLRLAVAFAGAVGKIVYSVEVSRRMRAGDVIFLYVPASDFGVEWFEIEIE